MDEKMEHVFISYVREDSREVDRLASQLRAYGIHVWLDRDQIIPGQRWREAIRSAIEEGAYFIACFSERWTARDRSYANEELTIAIEQLRQRPVLTSWFIPVALDGCAIPSREIGAGETLTSIQYVDLRDNWFDGIQRLVATIKPAAGFGREIRPNVQVAPSTVSTTKAIVSIDFGTSFSTVAVNSKSQGMRFIPAPNGRTFVPSVVSFDDSGEYLIGWGAIEASTRNPSRTIFNVKRLLGSGDSISLWGRKYEPEMIASLILSSLRRNAEEFLGSTVSRALISRPANFSVKQSNALARACELAGLSVERMIAEPNAAAILIKEARPDVVSGTGEFHYCLVLDLGGGTFDVSIVECGIDVLEVKTVVGVNELGGVDYDEALVKHIHSRLRQICKVHRLKMNDVDEVRVRQESIRAKVALSSSAETSVILPNLEISGLGLMDIQIPLDRLLARDLFKPLDDMVRGTIDRCLEIGGLSAADIGTVILAGQGSKLFTISEIVEALFADSLILKDYQEAAVIRGLCAYSGVLEGYNREMLLFDANCTSIGVKCCEIGQKGEPYDFRVGTGDENTFVFAILGFSDNIPRSRSYIIRIEGIDNELHLVETGTHPNASYTDLGSIPLPPYTETQDLRLELHVDKNHTIVVWLIFEAEEKVVGYQLSNKFKSVDSAEYFLAGVRKRLNWETGQVEIIQL